MFILIIFLFILVCVISVYYFYLLKKFEEDIEDLYDLFAFQEKSMSCLASMIRDKEDKKGSVLK